MNKLCRVTVLPCGSILSVPRGEKLSDVLRREGLLTGAFCGGQGKCGKCTVMVNGQRLLACRTEVSADMTVELCSDSISVLTDSSEVSSVLPVRKGHLLAFDIGTTTVVGALLDSDGRELAVEGRLNPQTSYGGDVVSRIRSASGGTLKEQSDLIRTCLGDISSVLCVRAGVSQEDIGTVSVVGNPAMQQLFLALPVDNLISIPFRPVITKAAVTEAVQYLPGLKNAVLLTIPDISAYVGADTVGCLLSSRMYECDELTLLVDIGTNGEMVLGNRERMFCCATAAGPALEGANIRFGMRAAAGAIDRVRASEGRLLCHVIGGGMAKGICGSGLIDAAAAAMELDLINRRGRIADGASIPLADGVYLTQEDIRQLQSAKGAIAAGIAMLLEQYGAEATDVDRVLLCGAFGSFLSVESACRIGLLPPVLREKTVSIGNAALSGAKLCAAGSEDFFRTEQLARSVTPVELSALPRFQRSFAENMYFSVVKQAI